MSYSKGVDTDSEPHDFLLAAKQNGASDQFLIAALVEAGWSSRRAHVLLREHYEDVGRVRLPRRHGPRESAPLDGFLYLSMAATLFLWTTWTLILSSNLIDRLLEPDRAAYRASEALFSVAMLIVNIPIYLIVMGAIHRRLKLGASSYQSPVRLFVLTSTVFAGGLSVIGYFVFGIFALLSGQASPQVWLKVAFGVTVLGALLVFYLSWLRRGEQEIRP